MAPPPELSDEERKVFDFITNGDLAGLTKHMSIHGIKPNIYDEHGMTPLTHACFKGNKEISQYLIDQGADVNSDKHEHGYTALHFAALSGNAELCQILLSADAKPYKTNSVGRTPAQMGGFVGNHHCVPVINNFIPKSDVDYYTVSHGDGIAPTLPATMASAFHKLIMQVNIYPIRIALCTLPTLVEEYTKVKNTLEKMSAKQMKGDECNEVMSFKLHYLAFVIGEIIKCDVSEKQSSPVEIFAKRILKPNSGEKYLDSMIRECIREFPHKETTIFRQMVTSLAGIEDPPSAISVITTVINGARGFADDIKVCATCCEETATKKCSKCKKVQYCDRECQRLHWFVHKKECDRNTDESSVK
uniref:Ankyrin repeat and MYND domain-containing protein 2 n=2 Tax=Lygus hesperus TaxID=30085 RepID=A0A0A9X057_LYGHE